MIRTLPRSLFVLVLSLALCLGAASAVRAAERPQEISALAVETLTAEAIARLQEAPINVETADARPGRGSGQKLFVLSSGVQLTAPTNPSTMIHASLSDKSLAYNHWVVVLNLGATATKKTTFDLTGPKKFNRQFSVTYGANSFWAIWYNPGAGVATPGIYTLKVTVDGGGNDTSKYYAN